MTITSSLSGARPACRRSTARQWMRRRPGFAAGRATNGRTRSFLNSRKSLGCQRAAHARRSGRLATCAEGRMGNGRNSRAPGGTGGAAEDGGQMKEENYPGIGSDARRRGAPWFKVFSSDWLAKTRHLSMTDVGICITLLAAMHEAGRPLEDDNRRLGRLCGCRAAAIKKAKETLITDGLLVRSRHGLWSQLMQEQIENERIKSKLAHQNVSQRWKKDKQNQIADDTAVRKEDIDTDASGGGPPAPPPSAEQWRSSSGIYTSDTAHREGFQSPPRVVEGERKIHRIYGNCTIDEVENKRLRVTTANGRKMWVYDEGGDVPFERAPFVDLDDLPPF